MRPRAPLKKDLVADAALAIVDRAGLRGLTIRSLAAELHAPPMTLYGQFASKEALLDLAFERMLLRLFDGRPGATWQQEIERVCRHARATLLEHPRWIPLMTRIAVPRWTLGSFDRLLTLVAKDGIKPEAATLALSSAIAFTLGSVLVERMMDGVPIVPLRHLALVRTMIADPERVYPRVTRAARAFDSWSFDVVFDVGLRAIVAGIPSTRRRVRRSS
jgi:AcrR family transcriptional regulator